MQRYRRDEYENLDEYETEEDEEEAEERDEGPVLTTEELEYLQLRQRLKESIRKQKCKKTGSAPRGAHQNTKSLPYDNYGSFFGPSKPVISQRVIQESKSILENQLLTSRNSNASSTAKKSSGTKTAVVKPGVRMNPPKAINKVRVPTQKRQDTRDYSFLFSEDAKLPSPTKEPPTKRVHNPQSEARSSQVGQKSKHISSSNGRQIQSGREERRPASNNGNGNMQRKPHPQQLISGNKSNMAPSISQKQSGSNSVNGPGRSVVKEAPSRMPVTTTGKKISAPTSKYQSPPTKKILPVVNRSLPSKSLPLQKQPMQPRREYQEPSRSKLVQKQPLAASSKSQMSRPVKQVPPHSSLQEYRPKKKAARAYSDDEGANAKSLQEYRPKKKAARAYSDDEGANAISMIHKILGYNPKKYTSRDYDDDSDMEVGFDDILREEKRSEKIARKEDEEELLKIEEEERRARERKRKMSQRR